MGRLDLFDTIGLIYEFITKSLFTYKYISLSYWSPTNERNAKYNCASI